MAGRTVPNLPAKAVSSKQFLALAGYIVGRQIGQGTYSQVRLAVKGGKRYAVKIIPRHLAPRQYVLHFLPRELAIIPMLKHPNIIEVFDILEIRMKTFVIMELATRGNLLQKITSEGRFSETKAFVFFEQIVDAVSYLHKQHIAHRDLKCENVLLNPNNQVKLADFSFVRYVYNPVNRRKMLSETFCGSAAYAAPEVIQNIRYLPKRHDTWSLGVILYVMVCGQLPFDDSNPFQQVRAQMSRQIPFPTEYKVSKTCTNLIRHLLEPIVLYRCTATRAMKHPWMRRERIKRKLKHIKDKRTAENRYTREKGQGRSSSNGAENNGRELRPIYSEAGVVSNSGSSSAETFGPLSASMSALPKRNRRSRSRAVGARHSTEEPNFISRTEVLSDVDDRPTSITVRKRRPRRNSYYRHERKLSPSPPNFYPQPDYPYKMQHAAMSAGPYQDPSMCMGGVGMYPTGGMPTNWGMPVAGGMFPPQCGLGYQVAGAPYGPAGPRPHVNRRPRRRGSQGDVRKATVRVNTPRAHLSVSTSSSASGEYY
ncbi:testis-specific serine/threonine-protein kinase 2-like [Ixodes scapularis]|uniref:testis-specific serine/threonine-protein kinase 2-like n=1 Tax=Ixodes scapularis TaxID=6945 RepID=UPI001AD60928|nr:testis-specific serine/threonine-protein kinase 2-like [Ixodes scapularis]